MPFVNYPKTWEDLRKDVEENGGVKTYPMEVLRDIAGFRKLGVHVRPFISKQLSGAGLGHVPGRLPDYQEEGVRVFKLGTRLADIIEAARTPGETEDATLRAASGGGGDAEAVLLKIRELVDTD